MPTAITVSTVIDMPVALVWEYWTNPVHITKWNVASDDWCCPTAVSDLRTGGTFSSRMEAKDGSMGFDFEGVFTSVIPEKELAYTFGDRKAFVKFEVVGKTTRITETFDPETENPIELQQQGWQAILENFKRYAQTQRQQ